MVFIAVALLVLSSFSESFLPHKDDNKAKDDYIGKNYIDEYFYRNKDRYEEKIIQDGDKANRIMVIPIKGIISSRKDGEYNHQQLLDAIKQVEIDDTIKGVLLKIDSGGGAVYETAEFYDKMKKATDEREIPIYASFGGVAASGGYYMGMLADKVFVSNETTTGSIGVIMNGYNVKELLDKVGIEPQTIKSGKMKDIMALTREMTKDEKELLQNYVDESFDRFVKVVSEGRDMEESKVRELADGRIYSGAQAKEKGLIDEIGYWDDSLNALQKDHELENAQIFEISSQESMFDSLFPSFLGRQSESEAGQINQLLDRLENPEIKIEYRWEGGDI